MFMSHTGAQIQAPFLAGAPNSRRTWARAQEGGSRGPIRLVIFSPLRAPARRRRRPALIGTNDAGHALARAPVTRLPLTGNGLGPCFFLKSGRAVWPDKEAGHSALGTAKWEGARGIKSEPLISIREMVGLRFSSRAGLQPRRPACLPGRRGSCACKDMKTLLRSLARARLNAIELVGCRSSGWGEASERAD